MTYVFRCLNKKGEPEYLVSDNNGNILAKDYVNVENLGQVSIDMPLGNYHDGEFFSVYLAEKISDIDKQKKELTGQQNEITSMIKEIENYKMKKTEKK